MLELEETAKANVWAVLRNGREIGTVRRKKLWGFGPEYWVAKAQGITISPECPTLGSALMAFAMVG
jgi:hypothetical protein